jgi:carboxylesterase type B
VLNVWNSGLKDNNKRPVMVWLHGGVGVDVILAPVVEEHYLSVEPFDPIAIPSAAHLPLMIGCTRDESGFNFAKNPRLRNLAELELRKRPFAFA